jgi:sulfur-oxidizing protein SoxX
MPSAEPRSVRLLLLAVLWLPATALADGDCAEFRIVGDAVPEPLSGLEGDPRRGRDLARAADGGDCTLCHRMPLPERHFHGTVGPPLDRVGARLDAGQIRLRIAAPRRLDPDSVMPSYCTTDHRHRVALGFVGESILSAQQIEHLVAWLTTLDGTAASPETTR